MPEDFIITLSPICHNELRMHFRDKRWNVGDWTSLETVEIDDTVGGIKITSDTQRDFLRIAGKVLKGLT